MTNLSPATQAIIDASNCAGSRCVQLHIAGALRALAARINGADAIRQDILDIADELEGQFTGPFTVQGLNWPATLGDFTLVGPVNNEGAWRWYERYHNGTTERIKVDHQLHPLGSPHHQ
jgi:hypothetical protein